MATVFKGGCLKIAIMKIKDLHGKSVEVTELDKAIMQAENFKSYTHEDENFAEFDKIQNLY